MGDLNVLSLIKNRSHITYNYSKRLNFLLLLTKDISLAYQNRLLDSQALYMRLCD